MAAVVRSSACLALICRNGLVAVLSRRLCDDLGLDAPGELRGLHLESLWRIRDRPAVARAFAAALRGQVQSAEVDFSHAVPGIGRVRATFTPGPAGGTILMMLDGAAPA
jgi:hypothetical protein